MLQANAGDFIYIFYGTFDKDGREALAPKGEFFTKYRDAWMPEVPGRSLLFLGLRCGS